MLLIRETVGALATMHRTPADPAAPDPTPDDVDGEMHPTSAAAEPANAAPPQPCADARRPALEVS